MKSLPFRFPLSLTLGLLALPALASAEGMKDDAKIKATGNANANTPALPAVPVDSPSGAFGDQGQIAVSSDSSLSISHTSVSGESASKTEIVLLPAIDYFVVHNLSIGGFVGLDYVKVGDGHSNKFEIGPRVGYNLPLSKRISFWPKLGFSYTHSSSSDLAGGDTASGNHIALNLFAPFMFHPVTHFFVGFGPALDTDLSGDAKQTVVAARLTIGGWFGPWH